MSEFHRQWVLKSRPVNLPIEADFELQRVPVPSQGLPPGHILVRNSLFLCAPTMRNWMDAPSTSGYPSTNLGSPVIATSAGRVIESTDSRFPAGCRVTGIGHWAEYDVIDSAAWQVRIVPEGETLLEHMGPVGMNALTAYFGVMRVGKPRESETVLVSGAAGSTGSVAAQIARILGCRVVGVAGGPDKCRYLLDALGLEGAINYRKGGLVEQVARQCHDGVDVFFDNVGGDILQAAIENMNRHGRVVLCGQVSGYNGSRPINGPTNMMRLVYGSVTMQGFLLGDYEDEIPQARADLRRWLAEGELIHREDIREGFEALPTAFGDVLTGGNNGTLLVTVGDDVETRV